MARPREYFDATQFRVTHLQCDAVSLERNAAGKWKLTCRIAFVIETGDGREIADTKTVQMGALHQTGRKGKRT